MVRKRGNVQHPKKQRRLLDVCFVVASRNFPFKNNATKQETRRMVIVEFPSTQKAEEFYQSPDYQAAIAIRKNAAQMDLMIVGGFE